MLRSLKELFDALAPEARPSPAQEEHALQLACAVLLVETMRAEPGVQPAERAAVLAALRRKFTLPADELDRLVAEAEQASRCANDFFAFTSTINDRFGQPQKIRMIEFMWQVAYADGAIGANENHLISKIAGLLYVTHGEYIGAKLRAKEAAGLGAP
jgi:uncharacterized tellurite resistance protein B-like protein